MPFLPPCWPRSAHLPSGALAGRGSHPVSLPDQATFSLADDSNRIPLPDRATLPLADGSHPVSLPDRQLSRWRAVATRSPCRIERVCDRPVDSPPAPRRSPRARGNRTCPSGTPVAAGLRLRPSNRTRRPSASARALRARRLRGLRLRPAPARRLAPRPSAPPKGGLPPPRAVALPRYGATHPGGR